MTTPGDLDRLTAAALAALGARDLPRAEADALRTRCHAALGARRRRDGGRAAAWQALYDRTLEPAVIAILGGAVLVTTALQAAAILAGRVA